MNPDLTKIVERVVTEMRSRAEHPGYGPRAAVGLWADDLEAALSSPAKGAEPARLAWLIEYIPVEGDNAKQPLWWNGTCWNGHDDSAWTADASSAIGFTSETFAFVVAMTPMRFTHTEDRKIGKHRRKDWYGEFRATQHEFIDAAPVPKSAPAVMDLGKVMEALDNLRAETKRLAKQQKKIPNVCESGCEGRCVQCPQDFLNEQAAHIANLTALLDSLAPDGAREKDECAWMIYFYDTDRKPEIFSGAGAKSGALARFAQISASWNAVLLCEFARNYYPGWHKNPALLNVPTPALMDLGKVREALEASRTALEAERASHGHDHWDKTGEHGRNCKKCIAQWEASDLSRKAIPAIERSLALLDSLAPEETK